MSATDRRTIRQGNSAVIPFHYRNVDGTYADLSGYAGTLLVKGAGAAGVDVTITGTLRLTDHTYLDHAVGKDVLNVPGIFAALITVESTTDKKSEPFMVVVEDTAV